jgi:hypothetical protein
MTFLEFIEDRSACEAALEWVMGFADPEGHVSPQKLHEEIHRPDWLLWIAGEFPGRFEVELLRAACILVKARLELEDLPLTKEDREVIEHSLLAAERCLANQTDEHIDALNKQNQTFHDYVDQQGGFEPRRSLLRNINLALTPSATNAWVVAKAQPYLDLPSDSDKVLWERVFPEIKALFPLAALSTELWNAGVTS